MQSRECELSQSIYKVYLKNKNELTKNSSETEKIVLKLKSIQEYIEKNVKNISIKDIEHINSVKKCFLKQLVNILYTDKNNNQYNRKTKTEDKEEGISHINFIA